MNISQLSAGTYSLTVKDESNETATQSFTITEPTNPLVVTGQVNNTNKSIITTSTGGTGTYQTSGDFRAPIFYDSNDTTYYIDPNGGTSAYLAGDISLPGTIRLRNGGDLEALIDELNALTDKKTLLQLYNMATAEPYSFLFI